VPNLTKASHELFKRTPDEVFATMAELTKFCAAQKEAGKDRWLPPRAIRAVPDGERLGLLTEGGERLAMNDWSFTQLCSLARVWAKG
jgi:hypothetical protein